MKLVFLKLEKLNIDGIISSIPFDRWSCRKDGNTFPIAIGLVLLLVTCLNETNETN